MNFTLPIFEKTKMLFITLLTFSGLLLISDYTNAEDKTLYQKSFSTENGDNLSVSVIAGEIIVSSWDKNEVSVTITGKESVNEYLDFYFKESDNGVKVWTDKKSDWNSWSGSQKFKVVAVVPNNYNAELKTSGGDIQITSLDGELELATSGGDILIINSKGSLIAKTSGGDIQSTDFDGKSELKTSGGDIEALNSNGNIEAQTSGGDIKLITSNGSISGATSGGDIECEYFGYNEGIRLSTSGGDIELKLPNDFSADIKLKTSGGKAKCNYSPVKIEEVSKSKFYGKLNQGGKDVICKTSGGYILVENK